MKKKKYIILIGLSLLLTACAENQQASPDNEQILEVGGSEGLSDEQVDEDGVPAVQDETESVDNEEGKDLEKSEETENSDKTETLHGTKTSDETETLYEAEAPDETEPAEEPLEMVEFLIENPSLEYYLTESIPYDQETFLELEQLTETPNEIIDTEKWFVDNGLEPVNSFRMEDENYEYVIIGDDGASGYLLKIYRKEDGSFFKSLDFSDYRYAGEFKEEDRFFIEQRIWWARSVGDVLYVAIGHNTYTESNPSNGYLVAIDLNDTSVIWKSEPCVTNARCFEIIDNTIVCGYGFTAEPDYLNLVNRLDGTLIKKIPIKSMADYIIYKDDVLYVRTYNTNYTFQVYRGIVCRQE